MHAKRRSNEYQLRYIKIVYHFPSSIFRTQFFHLVFVRLLISVFRHFRVLYSENPSDLYCVEINGTVGLSKTAVKACDIGH